MKKLLVVMLVLCVFIPFQDSITAKDKDAPGIALEDTNGQFTMLSSLVANNNLVLSFWSYDCVPCRKEMPELAKLAQEGFFKENKVKLVFVYVEATTEKSKKESMDMNPKDKALEVLNSLNITETCLLDVYGVAFKNYMAASGLKNSTLPLNYLINKNKQIVFSALGYSEKNIENLKKAIKTKL